MPSSFEVLIIGGGPAGHTAALYVARAGRNLAIVLGDQPGGQLTTTSHVDNWPGDARVGGADLMLRMTAQIEALGVPLFYDRVVRCESLDDASHSVILSGGDTLSAKTVIIATGAQARWLDVPGEQTFKNRGVSGCAVCDGYFFKGRSVAVIGGGNTAVEEALYLSELCTKVSLIHRRENLRAERMLQDKLFATSNINVIWNAEVAEFTGDEELSSLSLKKADGSSASIDVAGAFVAIGHSPATESFRTWVDCDEDDYILVPPGSTLTSRAGVFAAGDVADRVYRQAVTSAGSGCMAALDAERYLSHRPKGTVEC